MEGAELTSWEIFSSNVRRETRSRTLMEMGSSVLQKGNELVDGFEASQENGGGDEWVWRRRTRKLVRINVRLNTLILISWQ